MADIITPDLCDEFPEVEVVEPGFNNYGGNKAFGGEIVTVKCFEDNSVVKEQVGLPGNGRVMVVDGGASSATRCWAICWRRRPPAMAGPA